MDPDGTLSLLLDALLGGDTDYAGELFEDLAGWIDRGGFPPADPRL